MSITTLCNDLTNYNKSLYIKVFLCLLNRLATTSTISVKLVKFTSPIFHIIRIHYHHMTTFNCFKLFSTTQQIYHWSMMTSIFSYNFVTTICIKDSFPLVKLSVIYFPKRFSKHFLIFLSSVCFPNKLKHHHCMF